MGSVMYCYFFATLYMSTFNIYMHRIISYPILFDRTPYPNPIQFYLTYLFINQSNNLYNRFSNLSNPPTPSNPSNPSNSIYPIYIIYLIYHYPIHLIYLTYLIQSYPILSYPIPFNPILSYLSIYLYIYEHVWYGYVHNIYMSYPDIWGSHVFFQKGRILFGIFWTNPFKHSLKDPNYFD